MHGEQHGQEGTGSGKTRRGSVLDWREVAVDRISELSFGVPDWSGEGAPSQSAAKPGRSKPYAETLAVAAGALVESFHALRSRLPPGAGTAGGGNSHAEYLWL